MDWLLFPFEALRQDIERIRASLDSTIARSLPGNPITVEKDLLTPTEHQVLRLASEGLSNPEIAERLGISGATVRVHLKDIRRRIGVPTREEAVAAFGRPTVRERLPWVALRAPAPPRVLAAAYEARAQEIAALVKQLPAAPSLEAIGEIENRLVDLGYEVVDATRQARGVERERLADLNSRLRRALEDIGLLRASLQAMISEALPQRIAIAQRAFAASVRVITEALR